MEIEFTHDADLFRVSDGGKIFIYLAGMWRLSVYKNVTALADWSAWDYEAWRFELSYNCAKSKLEIQQHPVDLY